MAGADVRAQQADLYGEPLADRFGRLLSAFRIPQSRLAQAIGLSAPMLSQLASGHRVKISNPGVYARLLRLEELADSPAVRSGDSAVIAAALDEVAASHPQLTTGHVVSGEQTAIEHLVRIADARQLRAAARGAGPGPLADLLAVAADRAVLAAGIAGVAMDRPE